MSKYLKYLLIYFFASYFLMAGAGYNVVNYCCQTCANEGIEAVSTSSCFAVHHHISTKTNAQRPDLTCSDLNHHSENCHLFRLSTDIPSFHAIKQADIKQLPVVNLFYGVTSILRNENEFLAQNNIPPPNQRLQRAGRSILTLHATFLI